jgi:hypothetical protein
MTFAALILRHLVTTQRHFVEELYQTSSKLDEKYGYCK